MCIDAREFRLPGTSLVCYFCNFFDDEVMGRVLERLSPATRCSCNEVYAIYLDPRQRRLFDDSPEWTVVDDKGWYECITGKLSEDLGVIPLAEQLYQTYFTQ